MTILIILNAVILVSVLALAFLRRPSHNDTSIQLLQVQLTEMRQKNEEQTARLLEQMSQISRSVPESLQVTTQRLADTLQSVQGSMGQRLDSVAQVVRDVSGNLGALEASQKRIFDIGQSIASFQNLLNSPKYRGEFGETLLEEVIRNYFVPEQYDFQHSFKNGQKVDAILKVGNYLLPIDAKFPMEDFQRMAEAQDPAEQKRLRSALIKNLQKKVDDIAEKYIRTDEGTFDFAFMYIPAENLYYELVVRQEGEEQGSTLAAYARDKKVVPVSPNTFLAYLHVVLHGLEGMKFEKKAMEIQSTLLHLSRQLDKFKEDFERGCKHLGDAQKNFDDAEKDFQKFDNRLQQIHRIGIGENTD